ncbi:MAG: hypothetical protein ACRDDH_09280 [Cetobacterium sp.]|uniref:hypothetical protein n=1 Tax=Cetobacterium sp. TaxID=2071632 RepID=UPI003EE45CA1
MNYVIMKTPEGDITFTYEGDDRLKAAFKDYEKICLTNQDGHAYLLNMMNTCEWDLKVDFLDGSFQKVEKYTLDEKKQLVFEREVQAIENLFRSEKAIALRIEEDFRLDLEVIGENEIAEVKGYLKSIKPGTITLEEVARPEIMYRYDGGK